MTFRRGGAFTTVGGEPVVYNSETGEVTILGHTVDSRLLIDTLRPIFDRIDKSRQRKGLDPKLSKQMTFQATRMSGAEIVTAERDMRWRSLRRYYEEQLTPDKFADATQLLDAVRSDIDGRTP